MDGIIKITRENLIELLTNNIYLNAPFYKTAEVIRYFENLSGEEIVKKYFDPFKGHCITRLYDPLKSKCFFREYDRKLGDYTCIYRNENIPEKDLLISTGIMKGVEYIAYEPVDDDVLSDEQYSLFVEDIKVFYELEKIRNMKRYNQDKGLIKIVKHCDQKETLKMLSEYGYKKERVLNALKQRYSILYPGITPILDKYNYTLCCNKTIKKDLFAFVSRYKPCGNCNITLYAYDSSEFPMYDLSTTETKRCLYCKQNTGCFVYNQNMEKQYIHRICLPIYKKMHPIIGIKDLRLYDNSIVEANNKSELDIDSILNFDF